MKKTKTDTKPSETKEITVAKMCGVLAGMCDHIGRMQYEMQDISGRCSMGKILGESLDLFTVEDQKLLTRLGDHCSNQYDSMSAMRKSIEEMSGRVRKS